jgi:hypothetical protein
MRRMSTKKEGCQKLIGVNLLAPVGMKKEEYEKNVALFYL